MENLLSQLGINWKLLFVQAVNFSVLLIVLTVFVYKHLIKLMEERRKKIEFGLKGADEAEKRLNEIETIKGEKLAEADKKGLEMIKKAEKSASKRLEDIVGAANQKAESIIKEAKLSAENEKNKGMEKLTKEASKLIKDALIKTVELEPEKVDEKLINQALKMMGK